MGKITPQTLVRAYVGYFSARSLNALVECLKVGAVVNLYSQSVIGTDPVRSLTIKYVG